MFGSKSALLKVEGLEKRFGGIVALTGYSVEIFQGEMVGLIGPNGAGKTTVFNVLSGVLKPTEGRIFFEGREITRSKPHENAAYGIARTFQNIRLFNHLSVIDNIKVAFHMRLGSGFWHTLCHSPRYRRSEAEMDIKAHEFLDLLDLQKNRNEEAGNLPYGIQRKVEIARAMATSPKLILLDEPAAGLNLNETQELIATIRRIHHAYGITIFLVEHDMRLVMAVCERIQVLDRGRTLTMGPPDEVRNDQRVIEAYLGKANGGRDVED